MKKTGIELKPEEFRKFNRCLECGKACNIKYEEKCEICKEINRPKCEICEIVLREPKYPLYFYNHTANKEDIRFRTGKDKVIEYIEYVEPIYKKFSEYRCEQCKNIENVEFKNKCFVWFCQKKFQNSVENFIKNGNVCPQCSISILDNLEREELKKVQKKKQKRNYYLKKTLSERQQKLRKIYSRKYYENNKEKIIKKAKEYRLTKKIYE